LKLRVKVRDFQWGSPYGNQTKGFINQVDQGIKPQTCLPQAGAQIFQLLWSVVLQTAWLIMLVMNRNLVINLVQPHSGLLCSSLIIVSLGFTKGY
jgi:hypothetical protein